MERIIFLGTGGDTNVISKQLRASGGIILQSREVQLHIDPGPGALTRAAQFGINLRANTAVMVSSTHLTHCNDINAVIDAMTYEGLDKKGVLIANKTVISGSGQQAPYATNIHKQRVERCIILEKGQRMGIEHIEIEALPTHSSDRDGIGFKFITPSIVIAYTSDTSYSQQLLSHYRGSNILILNVQIPALSHDAKGYLCIDDAVKIIEHIQPRLALITHFGTKMLKDDPMYHARTIQKMTGVQTIAVKDGMIINAEPFAPAEKQKTLQTFSSGIRMPKEITAEESAEARGVQKTLP